MELNEFRSITESWFLFRVTFRFSDKPSDTFSQDAILVLNICSFYIFYFRVSDNYSFYFIYHFSIFLLFWWLAHNQYKFCVIFWKNVFIVIVSIGKNHYFIFGGREFYSPKEFFYHFPASFLSPFSNRKCYKQIGTSFHAGSYPYIAFFIWIWASWLNFFRICLAQA